MKREFIKLSFYISFLRIFVFIKAEYSAKPLVIQVNYFFSITTLTSRDLLFFGVFFRSNKMAMSVIRITTNFSYLLEVIDASRTQISHKSPSSYFDSFKTKFFFDVRSPLMVLIFPHGKFCFFARINFRASWKSLFFAGIKFRASSNFTFNFLHLFSFAFSQKGN